MDTLTREPTGDLWLSHRLHLSAEQWEQMRDDVNQRAPEEACGLLAGMSGKTLAVFPLINVLHSQVRYRLAPEDQWHIFQLIEKRSWELLGIYHSHPQGPSVPSPTDITEAYYPEVVHLIWSRTSNVWRCLGFRIQGGNYSQVAISITAKE